MTAPMSPKPIDPSRSLVTSRLLDASPAKVFDALTDPARLARWWGPRGFRNTFEVCEPRSGGAWRYTMHGPDGRDFRNESVFTRVEAPALLVVEHRSKPHYELTVVLAEEGGKTRLTWSQTFETAAVCEGMRPLVSEPNEQNLDRLADELRRTT